MIESIRKTSTLFVLASLFVGCTGNSNPEIIKVTGKVTLDGEALPGAIVEITPITPRIRPDGSGGAGAGGETDDRGAYSLKYSDGRVGAEPGNYLVRITKPSRRADREAGNAPPPNIPAEYNTDTTLEMEVTKEGPNEFNFELKSK